MTDLLERVLDIHGALDNWRRLNAIDFRATLRGDALEIKQQPHGLRDVLVKVDTRRPQTLITPFPAPGSREIFENGRVTIETNTRSASGNTFCTRRISEVLSDIA